MIYKFIMLMFGEKLNFEFIEIEKKNYSHKSPNFFGN